MLIISGNRSKEKKRRWEFKKWKMIKEDKWTKASCLKFHRCHRAEEGWLLLTLLAKKMILSTAQTEEIIVMLMFLWAPQSAIYLLILINIQILKKKKLILLEIKEIFNRLKEMLEKSVSKFLKTKNLISKIQQYKKNRKVFYTIKLINK